ncbi:hypothetical protein Hanom_Chr14g01272851 [Helianthus anomalus]
MPLTIEILAQDFDRVQVYTGQVVPDIHNFGHHHAWARVISMRISFAKCWKLVDASFESASAGLFSLLLIWRILKEVNFDFSCRACSR